MIYFLKVFILFNSYYGYSWGDCWPFSVRTILLATNQISFVRRWGSWKVLHRISKRGNSCVLIVIEDLSVKENKLFLFLIYSHFLFQGSHDIIKKKLVKLKLISIFLILAVHILPLLYRIFESFLHVINSLLILHHDLLEVLTFDVALNSLLDII